MNQQPEYPTKGEHGSDPDSPRLVPTDPRGAVGVPGPARMLNLPELPVPLTSFIGREDMVVAISELLCDPGTRLLTLTGPGGVGKTRLSLKVADALRLRFSDGVGFFALDAVRDPALVLSAIAHRLGVREGDRDSLAERLGIHLAGRQCLLLLDSFEQVAEAGPALAGLLGACPNLTLLVTSRAPLRVSGEQVFPVPPMVLAPPGSGAEVVDAEAVRLFVARAEAVRPGVTLTEAITPAIAEICSRLDGLPLAIELAAARSNLFAPPIILTRLNQRLSMLTSGPRDQPARLQTMANAIHWSYDLLTEEEQALFCRLGVFVGGVSLSAALVVSGEREESVMASLETLVNHSLVQVMADVIDEPRYTMLETIREFGFDQLTATGEADDAQERHALYFTGLAERIDMRIDGPETSESLRHIDLDRSNLRAALAWLIDHGRAEGALRLSAALWRYWRIRGHLTEGRDGLASALELPGLVPPAVRADALWKLAYMFFFLGAYDPARDHYERSVALFTRAGDRSGEATSLDSLGLLLRVQGDFSQARDALERALAIRRELGERFEEEITLANLGMLAVQCGNLGEARALLKEALAIARELGAEREIGHRCLTLARVELEEGRVAAARDLASRALAIFEALGDQIAISMALESLGEAANGFGNHQQGAGYLVASLRLRLKLGLQRDLDRCVEHLANAAVSIDPVVATRLLAAASVNREASGIDRWGTDAVVWDDTMVAARAALGAARFDEVWQAGQRTSLVTAARAAEVALAQLATTEMDAVVPAQELTPRELEILQLVAAGHTNREIAGALFISPATVKRHVTNILARLQVPTRAAAISYALREGLIDS